MKRLCKILICVSVCLFSISMGSKMVSASSEFTRDNIVYQTLDGDTVAVKEYIGEEQNVEIPEHIEGYKVVSIAEAAFEHNQFIHTVVLPKSIVNIERFAFRHSTLEQINMPEFIEKVGAYAFYGTPLYEQAGENIKYIDNVCLGAIEECKLTNIHIREETRLIADVAFYHNENIVSVELPSTLKFIGEHTFKFCSNLTTINLPDDVEIGTGCFYRAKKLTNISGNVDFQEQGWEFTETPLDAEERARNIGKTFLILFTSLVIFVEALWIAKRMIMNKTL